MSQEILDAIPLPALIIGDDERISAANSGMRALVGEGIVGRHYIAIIRQPALLDAIEKTHAQNVVGNARYLSSEAGREITWQAHVDKIGGSGSILVTLEDQTHMAEAGQMRRDFVANVSHELRTPLTALLGFIETLRGAAKNDPAAQERFLSIMENEASRMNRLVRDLLSLNRVESVERLRPSDKVDLAAVSRSVINALSPVADECEVDVLQNNLEDSAFVRGDQDQLAQVLTNLLENGIKYSGRGRTATVAIETQEENRMLRGPAVVVRVQDTGDGIDPLNIPRLTERFYRIDSHRSRQLGGTGLGLAIVKHIVSRHRGRLRIESTPGSGSEFSAILPKYSDK
ncbi:MAG: two-component sensor histidine kinase [Boseongicola sp.]|nr:MAG: two-component sensor histidine kinase [Boseongicola sp.]